MPERLSEVGRRITAALAAEAASNDQTDDPPPIPVRFPRCPNWPTRANSISYATSCAPLHELFGTTKVFSAPCRRRPSARAERYAAAQGVSEAERTLREVKQHSRAHLVEAISTMNQSTR